MRRILRGARLDYMQRIRSSASLFVWKTDQRTEHLIAGYASYTELLLLPLTCQEEKAISYCGPRRVFWSADSNLMHVEHNLDATIHPYKDLRLVPRYERMTSFIVQSSLINSIT